MSTNKTFVSVIDMDAVQVDPFVPTLDLIQASGLALFAGLVYIVGILVQWNIFKFLKRKIGRNINKMIYYEQVSELK